MSYVVPALLIAVPLAHLFPSLSPEQIQPLPIHISGVACTSPAALRGLYTINSQGKAKSIPELVTLSAAAGYNCIVLSNTLVFNGGPVIGPDGLIPKPGQDPASIFEMISYEGAKTTYYYIVAKKPAVAPPVTNTARANPD